MHDAGQESGRRKIWAAVPFKGPVGSKRRLAGLLDPDERARLSLAMLDGVLDALHGVAGIERVLLLSPRPGTAAIPSASSGQALAAPARLTTGAAPREPNAGLPGRLTVVDEQPVPEQLSGGDNLNHALRQAQALATDAGADALLIVPGDLPLVTSSDVQVVLDASDPTSVVLAPDRAGDGTNALLLAPPDAIAPSFGEASFERHRALAGRAGLASVVVERPGLALDLDTPADVSLLLASGQDCRAARLLRELGVADRLERLATSQARSTTI